MLCSLFSSIISCHLLCFLLGSLGNFFGTSKFPFLSALMVGCTIALYLLRWRSLTIMIIIWSSTCCEVVWTMWQQQIHEFVLRRPLWNLGLIRRDMPGKDTLQSFHLLFKWPLEIKATWITADRDWERAHEGSPGCFSGCCVRLLCAVCAALPNFSSLSYVNF